MNKTELKATVRTLLDNTMGLQKKGSGYERFMYAVYDDKLMDTQLKAIAEADNKMYAFYDQLDPYVLECGDDDFFELMRELGERWREKIYEADEDAEPWEAVQWDVQDIVTDLVDFRFEYEHFLKQDVRVNIILNTGDGNYDFTCNNLANFYADGTIPPESSLLWLVKQQGYTKTQLRRAIQRGKFQDSRLLKSIYVECINSPTLMNALTFFVTMQLKDYIAWMDGGGDITLSRDTACGLWNPWTGGGSVLEIELEKDVTIPAKYCEAAMDGVRGQYSVDDVYGMMHSFWTDSVVKYGRANGKTA